VRPRKSLSQAVRKLEWRKKKNDGAEDAVGQQPPFERRVVLPRRMV
jgi:hypothetical protein